MNKYYSKIRIQKLIMKYMLKFISSDIQKFSNIFKKLDVNRNHSLSKEELCLGLKHFMNCTKQRAEKLISKVFREFSLKETDELCYNDFIVYWIRKNLIFKPGKIN